MFTRNQLFTYGLLAFVIAIGARAMSAESERRTGAQGDETCSVPKSYGALKAGDANVGLVFEDAKGTVRIVGPRAGCKLFITVTRP